VRMSDYPVELRRDAKTVVRLDPTRLLLSFREPKALETLVPRLGELGLELEPHGGGTGIEDPPEVVNHTDRRFWVRTTLREPVDDDLLGAVEEAFGRDLEWIGPVYQQPSTPGRTGLHCPLPNILIVEASDAEVPLKEDADKSRHLAGYRYYVIDEPRRTTAYSVRPALLDRRSYAAPDAVLFENMPLVSPLSNEPADTFYQQGRQWNMTRIRAFGPGQAAWDLTISGATITIAVIDSGCDLTHPDLIILPGAGGPSGNGANNPGLAGFAAGHGTMCAGVAGATTHNLKGVAGVAGYTCRILPFAFTNFTEAEAAQGISFAVRSGARVISMSFNSAAWNPVLVDRAIEDAYNNDVVMCASSGNAGAALGYPATHPHIIACGATDMLDARAGFSNFGTRLSVMAPGVNVPTTTVVGTGDLGEFGATGSQDYVAGFWGTSAAAPHVAGLAALILSVDGTLSSDDVRDIIEGTADKVGGVAYATVLPNGPWDPTMGYGRINALDAALAALPSRH
jgi:subtilisin family serine protease